MGKRLRITEDGGEHNVTKSNRRRPCRSSTPPSAEIVQETLDMIRDLHHRLKLSPIRTPPNTAEEILGKRPSSPMTLLATLNRDALLLCAEIGL